MPHWLLHPDVLVPLLSLCFLMFGDEAGRACARIILDVQKQSDIPRIPLRYILLPATTADRAYRAWMLPFALLIAMGILLRIPRPLPGNEGLVEVASRLFLYMGVIFPVVFTVAYLLAFARTYRSPQ